MQIPCAPRRQRLPARLAWTLCTTSVLVACGADEARHAQCIPEPQGEGPFVEFKLSDKGRASAWLDVPFPSDIYRDAAGRVALPKLPYSGEAIPLLRDALNGLDGFSVTAGAMLRVEGEYAAGPLPAGSVRLLQIGGESTSEVPVEAAYNAERRLLGVMPAIGQVLLQSTEHLLVVTRESGLNPSAKLASLLPGGCAGPEGEAVAATVASLDRAVISTDDVAAAVTFTTRDITADLDAARVRIQEAPPGELTVKQVVTEADGGLTDLLGPADDERPGFGGRAPHAHTSHVIHGTFTSPAYLTATPRGQGMFTVGDDGLPEVKAQEPLPFTLTLPAGSKKDLPLVLFQHGVNADRAHMFAVSDTLAAAGAAVLGVDLPMHGDRQPELQDVLHNVTAAPGPDGMADRKAFLASTYMFGLLLHDLSLPAYHPHLARDAFRQGVIDHMSVLRSFSDGDLAPVRESDPDLAELSFDASRVSLIGQSLGAIVGGITLALEPRIGQAALVVGGGGLITHLATKSPTYTRTIVAILAVPLGFEYGTFEYEQFPPWYLPEFQLYQWAIEPGDPLAYAPYAMRAPRDFRPPPDVLFMAAYSDESVPNQSSEALAGAYGAAQVVVEGVTNRSRYATPNPPVAETPLTGNQQTPAGKATSALYVWDPAAHDLLIEPGGRRQYKPGFPAFERLDDEEEVVNPVARVQAVVTEFLVGERGPDGRAQALAP